MRHSDSSPPIPPRFVAFARRYHPSTCGSLRRTPGATSTASGLVSRCPRPGGLYDGDDEASRVPGKPTRTHATRSDPGEVAASTASETRRDDLPSNARRRPSHSMHFGAQLRGLRAPCERFAPWVTPGPRITRFRLAADLGRMGLDTHRVSNKVSKITSRHLVPLDRAFPAHALVHNSRSRSIIGVYPGFPTLFWGLSVFFVGDLMGKALWKLVENAARFPRRGGRVLCVHGAVSFHRARPCGPRWLPGRGAMRHVELDRRVLGLQSTGE